MISRRQFIVSSAAFGGGMALGIVAADSAEAAFLGPLPWVEADALPGAELNPWISIGADDIVTIRVATPEIGNGAMTQTPMLVAEERPATGTRSVPNSRRPVAIIARTAFTARTTR
jgi:isoquinoline 1-oxidoreductase beta subunit